MTGGAGTF